MVERRRGPSKALHDVGETECCELYGEYCYPCPDESVVASQKHVRRQRKRRRK